jgi:hypothetical protein
VQGTVSIHISRCYVRIHSVVYPPEIPKFWKSWAEFPVLWKIHP